MSKHNPMELVDGDHKGNYQQPGQPEPVASCPKCGEPRTDQTQCLCGFIFT